MTRCDICGVYGGFHLGGCPKYEKKPNTVEFDYRTNAERERDRAIHDLTEAIRFTVEYIGISALPPIEGWSWYDAMVVYAPEKAKALRAEFERRYPEYVKETDGPSN